MHIKTPLLIAMLVSLACSPDFPPLPENLSPESAAWLAKRENGDAPTPTRLAIDTTAAKQLVAAWQGHDPGLGCLHGHQERVGVVVIDSVRLAPVCGAPAIGMVGFLYGEHEEQQVLRRMADVLRVRGEFALVGQVVGLTRVRWPGGGWGTAPLVWGAVRDAPSPLTTDAGV